MDDREALESAVLDQMATEQDAKHDRQLESLNGIGRDKARQLQTRFLDQLVTASALSEISFPPINFIVPDYVPEGLTILAGKPKKGKSWMALDIACAVAFGGCTFGQIQCEQGAVLYLALEDNKRRLQKRLEQLLGDRAWPSLLSLQTEWPPINDGGLSLIKVWLETTDQARLVIIDTFAKVRPPRGGNQAQYDADYAALTPLQHLAGERGIAILVIHHLRKGDAEDPLDMVSGSTGLTGAPDTILVLTNDEQGYTVLHGTGRDIEAIETAIRFDKVTGQWSIVGDAEDVRRSEQRSKILSVLQDTQDVMGPKDIATATGLNEASVRHLIKKMVLAGDLEKKRHGKYAAL